MLLAPSSIIHHPYLFIQHLKFHISHFTPPFTSSAYLFSPSSLDTQVEVSIIHIHAVYSTDASAMSFVTLPQEIVLLVCEQLASRNDFPTLFRYSLISKRVAGFALEYLYR